VDNLDHIIVIEELASPIFQFQEKKRDPRQILHNLGTTAQPFQVK